MQTLHKLASTTRTRTRTTLFVRDRFLSTMTTEPSNNKKIVVFGGNGYVGQSIVSAALQKGVDVLSISRSGAPPHFQPPSSASKNAHVEWIKGDIHQPDTYAEHLRGVEGAVSCVGGFGSNAAMERINGDANVTAIHAAVAAGVPRFVFISAVDNNLPDFVLKGYFHGKRAAERALADNFPQTGLTLRASFVSGTREVHLPWSVLGCQQVKLPLWMMGGPLKALTGLKSVQYLRDNVPGMKAVLAPPIDREDLGKVAVEAALGNITTENSDRVINITELIEHAKRLK